MYQTFPKGKKPGKKHRSMSNVYGNVYFNRPVMGRSDDQVMRARRDDYGKDPQPETSKFGDADQSYPVQPRGYPLGYRNFD